MNRRDFVLVARALRASRTTAPEYPSEEPAANERYRQWCADVDGLAAAFEEECAHFDRDRFVRECGR